jgi:hypothetical protein
LNSGFDDPEQDEPLVGVNTLPAVAPVTVAPSSNKAARIDFICRFTHRRAHSLSQKAGQARSSRPQAPGILTDFR